MVPSCLFFGPQVAYPPPVIESEASATLNSPETIAKTAGPNLVRNAKMMYLKGLHNCTSFDSLVVVGSPQARFLDLDPSDGKSGWLCPSFSPGTGWQRALAGGVAG